MFSAKQGKYWYHFGVWYDTVLDWGLNPRPPALDASSLPLGYRGGGICGYNILPKFVNQLIASSLQIFQIDSRHLLSYYMSISLVYYYTGVFCDIWTLFVLILKNLFANHDVFR